jgi:hypothetical protein
MTGAVLPGCCGSSRADLPREGTREAVGRTIAPIPWGWNGGSKAELDVIGAVCGDQCPGRTLR